MAGGDGVQVALILRASSFALGFVRRPPSHLGARCTSSLVIQGYTYHPRALSLWWGSLYSLMIKDDGSAVSNGKRSSCAPISVLLHLCHWAGWPDNTLAFWLLYDLFVGCFCGWLDSLPPCEAHIQSFRILAVTYIWRNASTYMLPHWEEVSHTRICIW